MSIVGTFPTIIQNGQPEDATVVMSLFSWIQSQVNGNACPATTTTGVLKGNGSGGTTLAVSGTDYLAPNADYAVATTSGSNAYLAAMNPPLPALVDGANIRLKAPVGNTGTSTLNVNSLGVKPILNYQGNALTGGELVSYGNIELTYNSNFNSGAGAWILSQTLTEIVPNASVAASCTGNAATATTAAACTGNSATATTAAACTGNSATATTAAACTGNSATATQLSTASGSAPSFGVRAWVNFDGTGANGNTAFTGGNIASVTKNGQGDYTVNFTTAMADANYAYHITFNDGNTNFFIQPKVSSITSSSIRFQTPYSSGTFGNCQVSLTVVR